jgi:hypothetical protein
VNCSCASSTWALPATGEVLVVEAAADCTAVARVGGDQVEVVAPDREPTWWERLRSNITEVLALIGFVVIAIWAARRFA